MSKRRRASIDMGDVIMKKRRVDDKVHFAVVDNHDEPKTPPTRKRRRSDTAEFISTPPLATPYPRAKLKSRLGLKRSRDWENNEDEPMPQNNSTYEELMYQYYEWDNDESAEQDSMELDGRERLPDRDGARQQIRFRIAFDNVHTMRLKAQQDALEELQNAQRDVNRCASDVPEEPMPG